MPVFDLMLFAPDAPDGATVFGGLPSVATEFAWPHCATCRGAMQFLGQLRPPGADDLLLVFMCANDPGLCEEWDADAGGNTVLVSAASAPTLAEAPSSGKAVRPVRHGARSERVDAPDYDAARSAWVEAHAGRAREVLGQMGGEPAWLQADETPRCDACGEPMHFVAQLEQGHDAATAMNFGGGCGYVFRCTRDPDQAKFLWQN